MKEKSFLSHKSSAYLHLCFPLLPTHFRYSAQVSLASLSFAILSFLSQFFLLPFKEWKFYLFLLMKQHLRKNTSPKKLLRQGSVKGNYIVTWKGRKNGKSRKGWRVDRKFKTAIHLIFFFFCLSSFIPPPVTKVYWKKLKWKKKEAGRRESKENIVLNKKESQKGIPESLCYSWGSQEVKSFGKGNSLSYWRDSAFISNRKLFTT